MVILFNAKNGILNQALVENIGCFIETNIKQILKHMIGSRTYNIDMYSKMVNFKWYQINTAYKIKGKVKITKNKIKLIKMNFNKNFWIIKLSIIFDFMLCKC